MRFRLLLFMSALFSIPLLSTLTGEVSPCCYRIVVDGKDRSAYQYVNKKLVTFADPSWKQDPTVEEVHLIDLEDRTGTPAGHSTCQLHQPPPVGWRHVSAHP